MIMEEKELKILDEYFRLANYLSCAMIYLKSNPLLRERRTFASMSQCDCVGLRRDISLGRNS